MDKDYIPTQLMRCFVGACDETCEFYYELRNGKHSCNAMNISEDVNTWIHKAENAIENQDRYKWHDIIKDPEDLPDNDRRVLVCGSKGGFALARHRGGTKYFVERGAKIFHAVAWKDIEPFFDD